MLFKLNVEGRINNGKKNIYRIACSGVSRGSKAEDFVLVCYNRIEVPGLVRIHFVHPFYHIVRIYHPQMVLLPRVTKLYGVDQITVVPFLNILVHFSKRFVTKSVRGINLAETGRNTKRK